MINLVNRLPVFEKNNAELVKIYCLFESYKDDNKVMFWTQDTNKAIISFTDGNMIIFNNNADIDELKTFVDVIAPVCIYSDYETLCLLDRKPKEKINVMMRCADIKGETKGDELSSKEIYELLSVKGLSLPEYPYFAVDYCRRKNLRHADFFALKNKCAVISFNYKNKAIINGIASHEKGCGAIALKAILQKNFGRDLLVCCRDLVKGFYEKNGFKPLYFGGYWVKE